MSWYVIHSKPNKEEFLYEQLCLRKVDAYYPSIKVRPINPRARRTKPYFPGYMFVNTTLDTIGRSTLRWIPGAKGLVDFGGDPASVPDEILQAIRQKLEYVNAVHGDQAKKFTPGQVVTIQSGPFSGYRAIFDSHLPGRERVRVLLQMLWDRQIGLELSAGQIEQANKRRTR